MGDHALDAILQGIDELEDDYDIGYVPTYRKRLPKQIKCRYCGKKPLIWRRADGNWRLFEPEKKDGVWVLHSCLEAQQGRFPPKKGIQKC